jgi:glyoxylase-like metal-dependent hydrolase (beta-lactamase superfamily II)
MQILKNVYVLAGAAFGSSSYVYGIKYSGGLVLIDAGIHETGGRVEQPCSLDLINENLRYWGLEHEKVTHVLLTHGHWDHAGLASHYREQGACITAHEADAACIEAGGPPPDDPLQHRWPPCTVDRTISGDGPVTIGELAFEALCIPGHTPGSLAYRINLEGKDVWFIGDFFPVEGQPPHGQVIGWVGDLRFSAKDHIASCIKLSKYNPDCVLAGHGYLRTGGCGDMFRKALDNALRALPSR